LQWQDHLLKPQRKRILGMALELYQQFLQEERDEIHEQANRGRPSGRLANLYQAECGHAYLRLADLFTTIGGSDKAEKAYHEAATIFRDLVEAEPQIPDHRQDLGASHNNLGVLYSKTGHDDAAEHCYQEALTIQKQLASANPHVPAYQQDLAGSFNNLGVHYSATDCAHKAEAAYQEVVAIRQQLAEAHPEVLEYKVALGDGYCTMGQVKEADHQTQAARKCYDRAVQILGDVLHKEPQHAAAGRMLFYAFWGRAEVLTRLRHHRKALLDWDQAIQRANRQDLAELRLGRALTLARAGDHTLATAEASELANGKSLAGGTLHRIACLYSLASAAARQDAKLAPSEQHKLAKEYAIDAIKFLRKLRATDFAKDPGYRAALAHKELDPLRSRDDFKKLLTKKTGVK
jgi:tetratricopeptide (TPR) repeat protein